MWNWLRNLFCGRHRARDADAQEAADATEDEQVPPWAQELVEMLQEEGPPAWAAEMGELLQKSSRAQGRLALRLDEMERKMEGGLLDLQQTLKAAGQRNGEPARGLRWDDLLDSMDLLDEAVAGLRRDAPSVAEGLQGVAGRLGRFLSQADLQRHGAPGLLGTPADGRLFRVMGTEERPDLPEGAITRVIRAAVTAGDRIVREGAVLTNRRIAGEAEANGY